MKYPRVWQCLSYEWIDEDTVKVKNEWLEDDWEMSPEDAYRLQLLDGTRSPHQVYPELNRRQLRAKMAELLEENLIERHKVIHNAAISLIGLFFFGEENPLRMRQLGTLIHRLLEWLWIPTVIGGILCCQHFETYRNAFDLRPAAFTVLWVISLFLAVVLHECGHFVAALRFDARIYGAGIGREFFVLPIGFVSMDVQRVKSRWNRARIMLAGVEMNAFLCGLSGVLSWLIPAAAPFCYAMIIYNALLAVLNCAMCGGLDGERALLILLGLPDVVPLSTRLEVIRGEQLRRKSPMVRELARTAMALTSVSYLMFIGLLLSEGINLAVIGSTVVGSAKDLILMAVHWIF